MIDAKMSSIVNSLNVFLTNKSPSRWKIIGAKSCQMAIFYNYFSSYVGWAS